MIRHPVLNFHLLTALPGRRIQEEPEQRPYGTEESELSDDS